MIRTVLAAAMALTLMSGAGFAQFADSSTTTESRTMAPAAGGDVTTTTHSATNRGGVLTEKNKTVSGATDVSPSGEITISRKKTETTTVHRAAGVT
jgi:predicted outer membrane protein